MKDHHNGGSPTIARRTRRRTDPPVVGVAGLGYMGLATALGFAYHGRSVLGYDVRPELRRDLARGHAEIHEPGLSELLEQEVRRGKFGIVPSWTELARRTDVLFLCLPTPAGARGGIDLRPLTAGVRELGRALRNAPGPKLVVVKSSVVAGTTEHVLRPLLEQAAHRTSDDLGVAASPEFLAEGTMVQDALHPERIVIGVSRPRDAARLRALYAPFRAPVVVLSPTAAELVKYASNSFLATKIALANEFARLSEKVGVDVDSVLEAVGRDSRIGPKFLRAGPGFGGSCFDKDLRAVSRQARGLGVHLSTLEAVVRSNGEQSTHAYSLARDWMGGSHGRRVAVLGLSFKTGTDDVRGSRALPIAKAALADGASVRVHDPVALPRFREAWKTQSRGSEQSIRFCESPEEALRGADVAILHTPWPIYRDFPREWSGMMRSPLVVDLRRALADHVRRRSDLVWVGLGASRPEPPAVAIVDDGSPMGAHRL
jgi:UDPglucose 6-dehydrogenase